MNTGNDYVRETRTLTKSEQKLNDIEMRLFVLGAIPRKPPVARDTGRVKKSQRGLLGLPPVVFNERILNAEWISEDEQQRLILEVAIGNAPFDNPTFLETEMNAWRPKRITIQKFTKPSDPVTTQEKREMLFRLDSIDYCEFFLSLADNFLERPKAFVSF